MTRGGFLGGVWVCVKTTMYIRRCIDGVVNKAMDMQGVTHGGLHWMGLWCDSY